MYRGGKVVGAQVEDQVSGKIYTINAKNHQCRRTMGGSGQAQDNSLKGKRLLLTKGVHLVVDHAKLPIRQVAYFDVPGGRMILSFQERARPTSERRIPFMRGD